MMEVADAVIRTKEVPNRVEATPGRSDEGSAHTFAVRPAVGFYNKDDGTDSPARSILFAVGCLIALIVGGCASVSSIGDAATFHASVPARDPASLVEVWRDARSALQVSQTPASLVRLRTIRGVDNNLTYLELVASLGDGREVALASAGASDDGFVEIRGLVRDGIIAEGPPVEDVLAAFDQLGGDVVPTLRGIVVAGGESLVYDARDWPTRGRPPLLNEVPLEGSVYLLAGSRLVPMTASDIRAFAGPFTRIAITHMVPVF